jgi:cystathionine beta-synthase
LQLGEHFGADDVVVIIFHDHGSRYVGKIFNDDWMRERGFLDDEIKVKDLILRKNGKKMISIAPATTVREAFELMKKMDISQIPVIDNDNMVGSLTENHVLNYLLENPMNHTQSKVAEIMDAPFPIVEEDLPMRQLNRYISKKIPAVVVKDRAGSLHILTKYDIIQSV